MNGFSKAQIDAREDELRRQQYEYEKDGYESIREAAIDSLVNNWDDGEEYEITIYQL